MRWYTLVTTILWLSLKKEVVSMEIFHFENDFKYKYWNMKVMCGSPYRNFYILVDFTRPGVSDLTFYLSKLSVFNVQSNKQPYFLYIIHTYVLGWLINQRLFSQIFRLLQGLFSIRRRASCFGSYLIHIRLKKKFYTHT